MISRRARPRRGQLRRTKGWHMPPGTVKVDRTTLFGSRSDQGVRPSGTPSTDVALTEQEERMPAGAIAAAWLIALIGVLEWALAQGKPADTDDGVLAFNNACRTCHTMREGDNRLGPNLYKIVGRRAGSEANYGYSSAMKGADLVWDKATLDRFIADPDQVVRGHNMKPYGGIAQAEERAKIIAYLEASDAAK